MLFPHLGSGPLRAQSDPGLTLETPDSPVIGVTHRWGNELERGSDHQLMERVTDYVHEDGQVHSTVDKVVVLASGMFYQDNGEWLPTREEIEMFAEGAVARRGPHKVIFPPELGPEEVVDLETSDGQRFQSQVLGLCYRDLGSGLSVWLAEAQPARAELEASNRLIYRDAFCGAQADLVYVYQRGGVRSGCGGAKPVAWAGIVRLGPGVEPTGSGDRVPERA